MPPAGSPDDRADLVRSAARWPVELAWEVLQLPATLRNIRRASERIGPVIDEVSDFARRADGSLEGVDRTLNDLQLVSGALSTITQQAQFVSGQWRRTLGNVPLVRRATGDPMTPDPDATT